MITHSLPVALALAEHPEIEVIVIGGKLYKHELVTIGAATVEAFRNIRADICFLGIGNLHTEVGSAPSIWKRPIEACHDRECC